MRLPRRLRWGHWRGGGRQAFEDTVPDILRWAGALDVARKEWLVLGKGPSFQRARNLDLSRFLLCSLNHVVRELPVTLAHAIDIEVVGDCREALEKNARFLVLPFFPHVGHRPTGKALPAFVDEMPVLRSLRDQGRLVWYNLSTSKRQIGSSPVIAARFFSVEAAVNILAACGVVVIRTLGVDGGSLYAPSFADLSTTTLLANGHPTFDRQFEGIAKTIRTRGILYAPLHKEAPIPVFVAAGADERLPARVLEYSIKRHATMSVDLSLLMDPPPTTGAPAGDALPASALARFRVPSLRGYRGRALYLEADMLVLDDLGKLWDERLEDCDLACPAGGPGSAPAARPSVLLMDCSRLSWTIQDVVRGLEEGRYSLPRLLDEYHLAPGGRIRASLPAEWHCAERHEPGKTRLLHYADRSRQPWRTPAGAWGAPWYQALREALAEGFIRRDEVKEEIEMGHVAPGLLGQLDRPVSTSDRP